jgi:hypothetical protein
MFDRVPRRTWKPKKRQISLHELLPEPIKSERPPTRDGYSVRKSRAVGVPERRKARWYKDIDTYENLRSRDVVLVNDLPPGTFLRVARDASLAGRSDVMDHLATDLVENYQCNQGQRLHIAASLVVRAMQQPSLLSYTRLHSILLILQSHGSLANIPDSTVVRLTKLIITHLSGDSIPNSISDSSVSILLTLLDRSLSLSPAMARGAAAVTYRPPPVVKLSYFLIRKLLHLRRDQQALGVFQVLVQRNNIPPEAIRETNSTSKDSSFIILSTLVRSCLHWGWRRSAVELCKAVLRAKMTPSESDIDLTIDVLYALLETPSDTDIYRFSYLIRELDIRAEDFRLPHGLIRLFYDQAHKIDAGKPAEILYEHTQSNRVISRHKYPPPQGPALTWLLRHLALTNKNLYLGRRLAAYVVDNYEPIPIQDRGRFVAIVASCGFGLQARALWERYSVGRDRNAVLGHPSAMVRMVSLYAKSISQTGSKIEKATSAPKEKPGQEGHSDSKRYEDRLKDVTAFADLVVAQFRRAKEPLATALHKDLTSLARAYFMLGDISAGFATLKVLLDRREMPDMHDINVALSALAEYTPRGAARVIERMINLGLEPDPVTFGTVIHFATIHRDTELVSLLIGRARDIDNGQLTLKSVQGLIRASIELEGTTHTSLSANLQRALEIIQSLTDLDFICSPNTGKYCIAASLTVHNPVLAFKFWMLLVRRKLQWSDSYHSILRRRIATQIKNERRAGQLDGNRAKVMMHALLGPEAKIHATR